MPAGRGSRLPAPKFTRPPPQAMRPAPLPTTVHFDEHGDVSPITTIGQRLAQTDAPKSTDKHLIKSGLKRPGSRLKPLRQTKPADEPASKLPSPSQSALVKRSLEPPQNYSPKLKSKDDTIHVEPGGQPARLSAHESALMAVDPEPKSPEITKPKGKFVGSKFSRFRQGKTDDGKKKEAKVKKSELQSPRLEKKVTKKKKVPTATLR